MRRSYNRPFFESLFVMLSTTLGAGIFALPYIFKTSGLALGILYLALTGSLIIAAHDLYIRVLDSERGERRLLGLVKMHLGKAVYFAAFLAIVIGLFLTLLVYLTLAGQFTALLFPTLPAVWGPRIFWIMFSSLMILGVKRLGSAELFGAVLMAVIILLVFAAAPHFENLKNVPMFSGTAALLPFGAALFALTGWPAVESIYELDGESMPALRKGMKWGTALAAVLYFIFVLGIIASSNFISSDTVSGLYGWPSWEIRAISLLGIFLIITSGVPIGFEIKNALTKDLSIPPMLALSAVIFIPPVLFSAGLNDFLKVVELSGGLFASAQYIFIILVGKKALNPGTARKYLYNVAIMVFLLAAFYETINFVNPNFFG